MILGFHVSVSSLLLVEKHETEMEPWHGIIGICLC